MSQTPLILCTENYTQPEEALHEGCPVLNRVRTLVVDKGVCANVQWNLRTREGRPIDLTSCVPDSDSVSESESTSLTGELRVRVADCDPAPTRIWQLTAESPDPQNGVVQFQLISDIVNESGIYRLQLGVLDAEGNLLFADNGLLSVERGLWGDTQKLNGPPTLGEIRIHLRDTGVENTLLDDVEFDTDEILHAVMRPVQQWNETPPPLSPFTCRNFPFRYHWLNATVAELMRTAAHHYVRNKMQASHGGLQVDDKNKDKAYLQYAELYAQEWREFILRKKVEINARAAYGTVGSFYGGYYG